MEMMVALAVSAVVLGGASTLLTGVASLNGTADRQSQAQETSRRAIDQMATQLRNAAGPPGKSTIYSPAQGSTGGTTELIFYVPDPSASTTNNSHGLKWVRYCLDYTTPSNEKLWMQWTPYASTQSGPPSTSTCPNDAWTDATGQIVNKQLVASNLVNEWTSRPSCGSPCSVVVPFTQAEDAGGVVHDIQVKLLVQAASAPGGAGDRAALPVTSSLNFRNVKSAPTPVLSCRVQNKHAICDASSSSDPDGEAIGFKWKRTPGDSTWEPGQSGYLFDSGLLTTGTYTVYVEVTDASGLYTDGNQSVVIP